MPRLLRAILILALLLANVHSQTVSLEEHLREHYQGKTLLLRGFLPGDHLYYDTSGTPISNSTAGDWTADGFVAINDVQIRQQSLILKGRRLLVVSVDHKFQFRPAERVLPGEKEKGPVTVEISVDLGADTPSAEAADAATSRIFLDAQDSLADMVPNYWKSCIRSGLTNGLQNCQFSPEILAIPGVIPSERVQSEPLAMHPSLDAPRQWFRVGNGVSPPTQIYAPEPEFSDAARGVKFQGTVALGLIVNTEGIPTAIPS